MGALASMESMESNSPPRPGMREPLSLTSAERLNALSIKSPMFAADEVAKPRTTAIQMEMSSLIPGTNRQYSTASTTALSVPPPIKPAKLLFGLTLMIPLLLLPMDIPKTKAKISFPKTSRKNRIRDAGGGGGVV